MYHEGLTSEFEVTFDQDKHVDASFIESVEVAHISVKNDIVYAAG